MAEPAVTALFGFILVKPIKPDTTSNLQLPDEAQQNKNYAEIIAISSDDSQKLALTQGDKIYVASYVDHPLEHEGVKYFFVKTEDVMGVNRG